MRYRFWVAQACLFLALLLTSGCTTGVLSCGPPVRGVKEAWPHDIGQYKHIVVVIEENKDPEDIFCRHCAPFLNKLAGEGASFTQMFGEEHLSQGNYLWLFSGSNHGVGYFDSLRQSPIDANNLGRALGKKGLGFTGYVESLPEDLSTGLSPPGCTFHDCVYGRKHVPWLSFSDFANDSQHTKSFEKSWPRDGRFDELPTVSFVVPNLNHDMHNPPDTRSVAAGDAWLEDNLGRYYEWAKKHNSLLIVTFDENKATNFIGSTDPYASSGLESPYLRARRNRIPTIFAGARIKHREGGYSEGKGITHVNILRTIEAMYDVDDVDISGGQQGCAAAAGITDRFIEDVFERSQPLTARPVR